jgi:hydroxymethylpyrimidine/phosphomethylpyrimidine kinase
VTPIALTVAGSDPSGGAGLQADLKTMHQHGVYGASVVTLITVQDTRGVASMEVLPVKLVLAQLEAVLDDMPPLAAKTGALGSPEIVREVGAVVEGTSFPWVVDPVWVPTRGAVLATDDLGESLRQHLIPFATLVTPNITEASGLAGMPVQTVEDAREAARRIAALGPAAVLITGGHLKGAERGTDVLLCDGTLRELAPRDPVDEELHGTGCALSASIASRIARGQSVPDAVVAAKRWIDGALAHAFPVGRGAKPVNHLWPVDHES